MNEQYIIDRILKDAKAEADVKVSTAKKNAAATLKTAKEEIELANEAEFAAAKANAEHSAELTHLTAKTEEVKRVLYEKREILDEVFTAAEKDLMNIKESERRRLVSALTKKYSQKGDKVTEHGGGIVISNNIYDLNLTIHDLLAALREETETDAAAILFK